MVVSSLDGGEPFTMSLCIRSSHGTLETSPNFVNYASIKLGAGGGDTEETGDLRCTLNLPPLIGIVRSSAPACVTGVSHQQRWRPAC